MGRVEFMKELAFLLQDLPQEEKSEALQYYNSYFFDAGEDNEESVIEELGSPERIAAIVRSELSGSTAEGEYTETGYQDFRFKDKKYEVSAEAETKKEQQNNGQPGSKQQAGQAGQQSSWAGQGSEYRAPNYHSEHGFGKAQSGFTDGSASGAYSNADEGAAYQRRTYHSRTRRRERNPWRTFALVMAAIFLSPVWIGLIGVIIGLLAAAFGLAAGLAAGTLGCLIGGIVGIGVGIFRVFSSPLVGMLTIAIALAAFGIGCLLLIAAVQVFRRLLPWIWGLLKSFWGWIFNRGGR